MANFATLKAAINAVIKTNGNKEITGEVLNQVLNAMVTSLGANYQFAGVATPSTNPGTPDQNVFYMATEAGTYTNFNATVLPDGISILLWNGSWSHQTFFEIDSVPTSGSDNFISSGAVFEKMKLDGGAYDVSAHNEGATFASLSALLNSDNLNTLIPVDVRHGGMSIKFVLSSDNKYVQYRLTSNTFTTTESEWQGVGVTLFNNKLYIGGSEEYDGIGFNSCCKGRGTTITGVQVHLVGGHKYRLYNLNPNYDVTGIENPKYNLRYTKNGTLEPTFVNIQPSGTVEPFYDFIYPSDVDYLNISIRSNETVYFRIEELNQSIKSIVTDSFHIIQIPTIGLTGLRIFKNDGTTTVIYANSNHTEQSYDFSGYNHIVISGTNEITTRGSMTDILPDDTLLLSVSGDKYIGGLLMPLIPETEIEELQSVPLEIWQEGKAITDEGSVVTAASYKISKPVFIGQGVTAKITTRGFSVGSLCQYNENNETFTPVVSYGNDGITSVRSQIITIPQNGYYVVCSSYWEEVTNKLCINTDNILHSYQINMIAGAFVTSTGKLFNGVNGAILKNFVSEKLLNVNAGDKIIAVSGLDNEESYFIAEYDEDYNYLGYTTNSIPILNLHTRYIRLAVGRSTDYTKSEKIIHLSIYGQKDCGYSYNTLPQTETNRWIYTVFEVKNTKSIDYPTTPTTDFVGETQRIYSKGYIVLPDNYEPNGKPCKVILNCHGTNQLTWDNTSLNYNIPYIEFLAKCGYAVIGCYSQSSIYSSERDTNLPSSIVMSTYQGLWDYMTRMFNLDKTGAYVFGYSAGGAETILLSQLKTIPIKSAACLAGTVDAICNMRLMWQPSEMEGIFTRFGIAYDSSIIPTYLSTLGRLKVVDTNVRAYMLANFDKIKPYNAITFKSTLDSAAFEEAFMSVDADTPTLAADATLNAMVNNASIYLDTPLKIWQAVDDNNVPIQPSRWFAKMVMNGGGICFLREFPTGCGAHYAVGNTEHPSEPTPMVNYVTPYGETINIPVAYAEMVEWFRKW